MNIHKKIVSGLIRDINMQQASLATGRVAIHSHCLTILPYRGRVGVDRDILIQV